MTKSKEKVGLAELRQQLEEQEVVDSLDDALEDAVMADASESAAPVEKRRRKRKTKSS